MRNSLDLPGAPGDSLVAVAMSGGVDSSVTAALLKEQGYRVIGITLRLYDDQAQKARSSACCAGADIEDARRSAELIGIPHYVLDFEDRFRAAVIDDFVATYAAGRTPIPCVRCNETVKFRDLLTIARDLGADALATGHYVRRIDDGAGPELHRAVDRSRDQSYFLFSTTVEQLDYLRFPLGEMPKPEVRSLARKYGLAVAEKPDSQDICFIPDRDHGRFIERHSPASVVSGEIRDATGQVLGSHKGVVNYTVGQRRGLGVPGKERMYVIDIDARSATITLGPRASSFSDGVEVERLSWLVDPGALADRPLEVRHRYNEPAVGGRLIGEEAGIWRVDFDAPQAGVAPGQACVLYAGDRLLGGGWIRNAFRG